jgi:hypothetical protein
MRGEGREILWKTSTVDYKKLQFAPSFMNPAVEKCGQEGN